jgi:hypothetical protein
VLLSDAGPLQVRRIVQKLKHKPRPENAYFKALNSDAIISALKEELPVHQLHVCREYLRGLDTIIDYDRNIEECVCQIEESPVIVGIKYQHD